MTQYKEYKNPEDYTTWIEDTVTVMRAQGLGELLDVNYRPPIGEEDDFYAKQAWTYMMLKKKVHTATGEIIVAEYRESGDAQAVLFALSEEALTSTSAVLNSRALLDKLVRSRFDPRGANASAVRYIASFQRLVSNYNEMQPVHGTRLNDDLKKSLLQASMAGVTILRAVGDREQESIIRGGAPLNYGDYLALLRSQAALYDEQLSGRRSANTHELQVNVATSVDDCDVVDEINEFLVNAMQRRMPGASMDKDTWESLSPEGKATWDKLEASDKRKVLQYAKQRAEKSSKDTISANTHEGTLAGNDEQVDNGDGSGIITEAEVYKVVSKARKESHPGDPRRVMGNDGKPDRRPKSQVNHIDFHQDGEVEDADVEDAIARYWNDDSSDSDSDGDQDFH